MSVAAAAIPPATPSAREQGPDAEAILSRMAEFLSKTPQMSVTVHGAYDAVQQDGSKVEWNEIRKVTLSRPDRLRIDSERSDGARSLILFDGKNITTFDESGHVYAQAPQSGGVDETVIHFVRDMHMRLPLAVLLLSRLPEELQNRVQTVDYVEKTTTLGAPAHHIVGTTATMDFQLWIAEGDRPLPLHAVLTYKYAPGQPQFRALFSDWNLDIKPTESLFAFTPPAGANKIPFAATLATIAPMRQGSAARTRKGGK
jgi:hypothetical protein